MEAADENAPAASRTLTADADRPRGVTRPCSTCGTPVTRKPSAMRGRFVFCDWTCRNRNADWHAHRLDRRHPDGAHKVTCDQCGATFPAPEVRARRSKSGRLFCSMECRDAARHAAGTTTVHCAECGAELERKLSNLARARLGLQFCGHTCWSRYRWKKGVAGVEKVLSGSGSTRRRWKLRWTKSEGRPPSYTPEQRAWVLALAEQGYGHEKIAATVGLSRDTVRRIRAVAKRGC